MRARPARRYQSSKKMLNGHSWPPESEGGGGERKSPLGTSSSASNGFNGNGCVSPDLINQKLPKELLLRIFSALDVQSKCRCAQVCQV